MTPDSFIFPVGLLAIALLLALFRLARGPAIYDRILAFDAIVICAAGLVVILSQTWHTAIYLELILVLASLGFFTTVAFAYYLQRGRGRPEDPDDN